jgi:hypothetical protein
MQHIKFILQVRAVKGEELRGRNVFGLAIIGKELMYGVNV